MKRRPIFKVLWVGPIKKDFHQDIVFIFNPKASVRQLVAAFGKWLKKNRPEGSGPLREMEPLYHCDKCGYFGATQKHKGCNYNAWLCPTRKAE